MEALLSSLPRNRQFSDVTRKFRKELADHKSLLIPEFRFVGGDTTVALDSRRQLRHISWFNQYSSTLPQPVQDLVFVLCIDEFQKLRNARDSFCEEMHGAHLGLRIVPVYFGLETTLDVLNTA